MKVQAHIIKVIAIGLLLSAFSYLGAQSKEHVKTIKALHRVFGKSAKIEIDNHDWITVFADNIDYKVSNEEKARHVSDSLLNILKPIIGLNKAEIDTLFFKSATVVAYRKHGIHEGVWEDGIEAVYKQAEYKGIEFGYRSPSIRFMYSFKGGFEMYSHIETEIDLPKRPYVSYAYLDSLAQNRIARLNQYYYDRYMGSEKPDSNAYNQRKLHGKRVQDFPKHEQHDCQDYDYTIKLLLIRAGKSFDYEPYELLYYIKFKHGSLLVVDPLTGKIISGDDEPGVFY